jgi:hypothetical protein
MRSTASPRAGPLVLALLSALVGNVGAQHPRCDQISGGCSTECTNSITVGGADFYKTNQVMTGCSCNGKQFPIYQKYTSSANNEFMYYLCETNTWGTAVQSGADPFAPATYSSHTTPYTSTEMKGCPVDGATCASTPTPTPSGPAPSGPAPSGPAPSGPAPSGPAPSSTPGTSNTSGTSAADCSDENAICAPMAPYLPSSCTCSGTNGGTGSFTECQKSLPAYMGDVGIKVELEPCDCGGAYAKVSYKAGGDWKTAGRLAAGDTSQFGVPGFSKWGAGLYIDVEISGDKSSLVVDVHLSLCAGGKCNGDVDGFGGFISGAGFPTPIVKDFAGVDFTEQCKCAPECTSDSSSSGMVIGIAIAAVVVVLLCIGGAVAGFVVYKKQKAAASGAGGGQAQKGVALTTPGEAPLPVATPVETKV